MIHFEFQPESLPKMRDLSQMSVQWGSSADLSFMNRKSEILAFFSCEDGIYIVYNTAEARGPLKLTLIDEDKWNLK